MPTMYDATNPDNIPAHAEVVAGYINGRYAWPDAVWERFPNAKKVRIQIYIPGRSNPDALLNAGDVLDIEAGDAPTAVARDYADKWARARYTSKIFPTIYTSKSGLQYLGHLPAEFWIADPTNVPHLLPGTVATQYTFHGDYDISLTVPDWPYAMPKEGSPMPNAPLASFVPTPTGKGYYMVGKDGGVFTFGDAKYFGSMGDKTMNAPVHSMALTPTGNGYWLVGEDYGVFAFGDAEYFGNPNDPQK